MRLYSWRCLGTTVLLVGSVSLGGCTGGEEPTEDLEVTEESAPEDAATADAAAAGEAVAEDEDVGEDLSESLAASDTAAVPAPSAAGSVSIEANRLVRFVNTDEALILGQPMDAAQPIGKLLKGDRVLVVEENGWGRIADGMFVKMDALSNKAVPRNRQPAVWQAPAH